MTYFCSSCQRLFRQTFTLGTRLKITPEFGKRGYTNTNFRLLSSQGKKTTTLPPRLTRNLFTQNTLYNFHDEDVKSDFKDLKQSNDTLEEMEDLTEEERQVLAELEEEERRMRERFKGGLLDNEDYSEWNPDQQKYQRGRNQLSGSVAEGHVPFENQQRIIQDVIEEIWNPLPEPEPIYEEPIVYPRGKTGVFDLGELVDVLKDEGADEIVAISLPKELDYADYMVIVTVMNDRQLKALATFVRKRFKMKERKKTDVLPWLDKKMHHRGWIALDLGNIILQIFLQDVRDHYDLEMLWTVGPVFDDLFNAKDSDIVQLLNTIK